MVCRRPCYSRAVAPRPIVLSGFMATGKSVLGRALAQRLGLPFIDTDAEIEAETHTTIPDLWRSEGEGRFRKREEALVQRLLADPRPSVIALGGGTVTIRSARWLALDRGFLVTLSASPEEIGRRVQDLAARPNLAVGDPVERARELLAARREVYAECHLEVCTEDSSTTAGASMERCLDQIIARYREAPLLMPLGSRSYPLDLGVPLEEALPRAIDSLAPTSILLVSDENVMTHQGARIARALEGRAHRALTLPPGEEHKDLSTVQKIWDRALELGIDRRALIIAVGGGVVGDLAGFAAATLLRGLRFVQVPTTVLAMADASVGGKTGFDHAKGKNLIGAIHQPSAVIADLALLDTLPPRQWRSGLAEIAKIALTHDAELWSLLEASAESLAARDVAALEPLLRRAIAAKARVVREDEAESGVRALLNLGHTVGHALEVAGNYQSLLHGEAVAIGTVIELRAAAQLGLCSPDLAPAASALLGRLGLPAMVDEDTLDAALPYLGTDKKRRGTALGLPVVREIGRAEVVPVELTALRAAAQGASADLPMK